MQLHLFAKLKCRTRKFFIPVRFFLKTVVHARATRIIFLHLDNKRAYKRFLHFLNVGSFQQGGNLWGRDNDGMALENRYKQKGNKPQIPSV